MGEELRDQKQWRMCDELRFIDGIGLPNDNPKANLPDFSDYKHEHGRKVLLKMYIDVCMYLRENWEGLNKRKVIEYAECAYKNC
jgi:hypothetical protein